MQKSGVQGRPDCWRRLARLWPVPLAVNLALGGGYPQAVNKVTTPYPGLPQSTVDLIKTDRVRMLVDWVRLTWH